MTATATVSEVVAPAQPSRWDRLLPWAGPLLVTLVGGLLRFVNLGQPHAIVFDETYYIKDALSLLRFGYERQAIDGADQIILDSNGDAFALDIFKDTASFVVHPPVGKWLIAMGEWGFGMTPFGWRFAVALFGTLSILLLARAIWLMTGSALWGSVAGLLLAVDGVGIVMSRTGILDGLLAFFVLAGFLALVKDRLWVRRRDISVVAWSWWRPWRLWAAFMFALSCGVKWSGIWFVAAFCVMTVLWEVGRRYQGGASGLSTLIRDGIPAFLTMVPLMLAIYLLSWTGWFVTDGGWDRDWAEGSGFLPALQGLLHYHAEMLNFHTGLSSEHSYQSPAWGWLIQARPTSFFFESPGGGCASGTCSQEVLALGNPVVWWAAILALGHQTWRWFAARDWRSGAVVLGVLAGWAPWLMYPDRTIFAFYTVAFLPFLIGALTLSLARIADPQPDPALRPMQVNRVLDPKPNVRLRTTVIALFLLVCLAISWYFYPIWSGEIIDNAAWSDRIWFPTWI